MNGIGRVSIIIEKHANLKELKEWFQDYSEQPAGGNPKCRFFVREPTIWELLTWGSQRLKSLEDGGIIPKIPKQFRFGNYRNILSRWMVGSLVPILIFFSMVTGWAVVCSTWFRSIWKRYKAPLYLVSCCFQNSSSCPIAMISHWFPLEDTILSSGILFKQNKIFQNSLVLHLKQTCFRWNKLV